MTRINMRLGLLMAGVVFIAGAVYFHRRFVVKPLSLPAADSTELTHSDLAYKFHRTISTSEKQHILDGNFAIITSTEGLSQPVKNAFATITGVKSFALADPNQKYQVTDVIGLPRLPSRRLIFAGVCESRWFIYYEHGGIGVSNRILVLDAAPDNSMRFVWGGIGFGFEKPTTLADLRAAIATGKFADNHAVYW
ncbi:hypothetical protein ACFPT7_22735 [Acidicapsa dinghuensis]|uniref:Uncharacterized protein n=1 Tax=Acidicapsa dinghuensis TaxID=2218256 RepID=A0ABW1EM63_9BACT|nr:hypothetical protein [Acidicapsa dinghuensis]